MATDRLLVGGMLATCCAAVLAVVGDSGAATQGECCRPLQIVYASTQVAGKCTQHPTTPRWCVATAPCDGGVVTDQVNPGICYSCPTGNTCLRTAVNVNQFSYTTSCPPPGLLGCDCVLTQVGQPNPLPNTPNCR